VVSASALRLVPTVRTCTTHYTASLGPSSHSWKQRGALRGTPRSAYPQPEPNANATELPSCAPGSPELIELQDSASSPTPSRAREHLAVTPGCRLRAPDAKSVREMPRKLTLDLPRQQRVSNVQ